MSIDLAIIIIMMIFLVIGIVDKLVFNSKYGYGEQFEEGMKAMGVLALAMVGIMCFAPILGALLKGPVGAVFGFIGADPAMIAGSILANDMGGYPLSVNMTNNEQIQHLSGLFMGGMMGATVVFSIPVSLGLIEEKDKPFLAKGMLAGFISIPFGVLVAGLLDGISFGFILINLVPSIVLSGLFALGLAFIPDKMMKGFNVFARGITILIAICLGLAIIRELTGFEIGFMKDMDPIGPQLEICGLIAITLAGAYPMVRFVTTMLAKPLASVGKFIGVNDKTVAGMIAALANNIPMFGLMKEMDDRGKILSVAFSVCASFALGDHLGYAASILPDSIFAMVIGKLFGGIVGIVIAMLLVVPKSKPQVTSSVLEDPALTGKV